MQAADLDSQGKAYMSLLSLSERARDLLGHGLDIENEYEDFGKNKRPNENLRAYVDRKYDLTAKATERDNKKKSDYEEKLRKEGEERYAEGESPLGQRWHCHSTRFEVRPLPEASRRRTGQSQDIGGPRKGYAKPFGKVPRYFGAVSRFKES